MLKIFMLDVSVVQHPGTCQKSQYAQTKVVKSYKTEPLMTI